MNIQLTNYGIALLERTKKPLQISAYELGSACGYVPDQNATGLRGQLVYSSRIASTTVVNGNITKYVIALDYQVGDFSFGEIAYYVGGQVVAIAVNEKLINKIALTNVVQGNSIKIDACLSMVANNYNMWADNIGSDIGYQVPVVKDIDLLPPVASSDPNLYLIPPVNANASSIIAFSANDGLWNFDCYQFSNIQKVKIVEATTTSITIDLSGFDQTMKAELIPSYFGDKVIEFITGKLYSICRVVLTTVLLDSTAILSIRTPLTSVPEVGDELYLFSRSQISISNVDLPIASEGSLGAIRIGNGLTIDPTTGITEVDFPITSVNGQIGDVELGAKDIKGLANVAISGSYNDLSDKPITGYKLPIASTTILGGIKLGNKFSITSDGQLGLAINPVMSVNNQFPDVSGNVSISLSDSISGLVNPLQIFAEQDLNEIVEVGLYYCNATNSPTILNSPSNTGNFTLEVIPTQTGVIQRFTNNNSIYFRELNVSWSIWIRGLTDQGLPIAGYENLGLVQIGDGLKIDKYGVLQTKVKSFNGRTGQIQLSLNDVTSVLQEVYDKQGGLPTLSQNPNSAADNDIEYGRINWLQLPLGSFINLGTWDAIANSINGDPLATIADGGTITYRTDPNVENPEEGYDTWASNGLFLRCSVQGEGTPVMIDGLKVRHNDYIVSLNNRWIIFTSSRNYLGATDSKGILVSRGTSTPLVRKIQGSSNIQVANSDGLGGNPTFDLTDLGKATTYYSVITDAKGRVTGGDEQKPTLESLKPGVAKGTMLYFDGQAWQQLQAGAAGSILIMGQDGVPVWATNAPVASLANSSKWAVKG